MSNKENFKGFDSRSEEVQELMETIPSWIQRWGITLITIIILGSIFLCCNIRLPQKIEIELSPLPSSDVVIISTPSSGKIHKINFSANTSISHGDTLLIFEDSIGNRIAILSPTTGYIHISGPLSTHKNLPGSIELLQIHHSLLPVSHYYGYIKSDYIKDISIGDTVSINTNMAHISFISPYPSSTGQYYIEVTTPYSGIQTSNIAHISISSETIFNNILHNIRLRQ